MANNQKVNVKAFISLSVAVSFVILIVSSVVLYIVPVGRVARWINWKILGLTKDQWESVHTIIGFAFIIFGVIHLITNWKLFWGYIVDKLRRGLNRRKEMAAALILCLLLTAASISNWFPASTIMGWGKFFKESWVTPVERPPVPESDQLNLEEFCRFLGIDREEAVELLESRGLEVDSSKMIRDTARENRVAPAAMYRIILPLLLEKGSDGFSPERKQEEMRER